MTDNPREGHAHTQGSRITRRTFLKGAAALGVAGLGTPLLWTTPASAAKKDQALTATASAAGSWIKNVVICSQENRSFDHYYGYASWAQNTQWGVPTGYSQPKKGGGTVKPYSYTKDTSYGFSTPDVGHSWTAVHGECNNGNMDGFYKTDGINAMGYYTQQDLPFYDSLFNDFTLCANYFCSVLGPTYPNRFYLVGGTSGGITTNGIYGYGKLDWPIILDLLEMYNVSWKVYNIDQFSDDDVAFGESDNVFAFFKRWAPDSNHIDPRLTHSKQDYLDDIDNNRLPQVSFIIDSYTKNYDEHPGSGTDIRRGMNLQQELIEKLKGSTYWSNTNPSVAYILTYDEHGGFFDHVKPPPFDAYGAGIRVPTWVISPYAKAGNLQGTLYEHSSVLKFIESTFIPMQTGMPHTCADLNTKFNTKTPSGSNYQAKGKPAPPRDGRSDIGDLTECFQFPA
jgi:phospholipase C